MGELLQLMSPATRAITLACRTQLDATELDELHTNLAAVSDWRAFSEHVERHRVSSIVAPQLVDVPESVVPKATTRALTTRGKLHFLKSLQLTDELLRMVQICSAQGIDTLHYKGVAAAVELYAGIGTRPFGDLDFLVRRDQIECLIELFEKEGYTASLSADSRVRAFHYRYRKEVELRRDGTVFEPHFAFAPASLSFEPGFDNLWVRRNSVALKGEHGAGVLNTPHPEDAVLIYAVAGAILDWRRLPKILDFSRATQRLTSESADPAAAWQQVCSHASEAGWLRGLYVSSLLAVDLLGVPLPEGFLNEARRDRVACRLARDAITTLDNPIREVRFLPRHHRVFKWGRWQSRERPVDRWRYLLRTTTVPDHGLVQRLPLPDWLSPVYFVITFSYDYLVYPLARAGLTLGRWFKSTIG